MTVPDGMELDLAWLEKESAEELVCANYNGLKEKAIRIFLYFMEVAMKKYKIEKTQQN